jgi:hypothetical protein
VKTANADAYAPAVDPADEAGKSTSIHLKAISVLGGVPSRSSMVKLRASSFDDYEPPAVPMTRREGAAHLLTLIVDTDISERYKSLRKKRSKAMTNIGARADTAGSLITIGIGAAMICGGIYGAIASGIPGAAWTSFRNHLAQESVEKTRATKIGNVYKDEAYKTVCPDYFANSWLKRHITLRNMTWCDDYTDKLND